MVILGEIPELLLLVKPLLRLELLGILSLLYLGLVALHNFLQLLLLRVCPGQLYAGELLDRSPTELVGYSQ